MPELGVSFYQSILRKLLGIRGSPVGSSVSQDIVTVIPVDDFTPEKEYGIVAYGIPANAGFPSQFGISVRSGLLGSDYQAVIEDVWFRRGTTGFVELYLHQTVNVMGGGNDLTPMRGNAPTGPSPLGVAISNNAAALTSTQLVTGAAAATPVEGFYIATGELQGPFRLNQVLKDPATAELGDAVQLVGINPNNNDSLYFAASYRIEPILR